MIEVEQATEPFLSKDAAVRVGGILSLTSFTRIAIVLSFLRQALGTPQLPPNPVLMGLSSRLNPWKMNPKVRARMAGRCFSPRPVTQRPSTVMSLVAVIVP